MADWRVDLLADGTWRLTSDAEEVLRAQAVTDSEGTVWVHVDGEVVTLAAASARPTRARAPRHASLEAPMPAQVTAVLVEPGDEVDAGATLVLLEAMKMELPLKAPTAGRVEAVHCEVGTRVAPGRALVELAPIEDAP